MSDQTRPRLATPTLCLVTDLAVVGNSISRLAETVSIAVENGVNMVQIRAPELPDAEFEALVNGISAPIRGRALTVVNPSSRNLAKFTGLDGVQLSESAGMSVAEARKLHGDCALVGRSVHGITGATDASTSGADFVVLGTIFPSATHPGGEWHGPDIVRRIARQTNLPVIGIGGLTAENVPQVIEAGACGVAVVRSILGASDPATAARELREALERSFAR